ncbi:SRPBCC family protein [Oceaniglobus indicus]|uniref:SRPBCC family protein n=1 Tax=Oceaniglobus indicus TaxID=2047749 RepID=UPI000C19C64A|nr:SRPBCC family protein [Oceaniglobus indicus]
MQLGTQHDIAAPIDAVFAACTDFSALERQALRRGIEVERTQGGNDPAKAAWRLKFAVKGKPRTLDARVERFDKPNGLTVAGQTEGMDVALAVELIALSRVQTRMVLSVVLKPRSMTARMMVQTMKLAKCNLNGRLSRRVGDFARDIARRHQA